MYNNAQETRTYVYTADKVQYINNGRVVVVLYATLYTSHTKLARDQTYWAYTTISSISSKHTLKLQNFPSSNSKTRLCLLRISIHTQRVKWFDFVHFSLDYAAARTQAIENYAHSNFLNLQSFYAAVFCFSNIYFTLLFKQLDCLHINCYCVCDFSNGARCIQFEMWLVCFVCVFVFTVLHRPQ